MLFVVVERHGSVFLTLLESALPLYDWHLLQDNLLAPTRLFFRVRLHPLLIYCLLRIVLPESQGYLSNLHGMPQRMLSEIWLISPLFLVGILLC